MLKYKSVAGYKDSHQFAVGGYQLKAKNCFKSGSNFLKLLPTANCQLPTANYSHHKATTYNLQYTSLYMSSLQNNKNQAVGKLSAEITGVTDYLQQRGDIKQAILFGLMAAVNIPIYAVSTMIPVMLIAIGVADGIHLYSHLQLYLRKNPDASKKEASTDMLQQMWKPVAMTSV